ncbi:erythromycin esterase family protein [Saccharicrinis sp. FJH2]|uniref:erythromycin esterase family protein n=1 Tax=Saccharicrinis sp. FJH65 TaxID=3344659 RepID=UPI0035F26F04
MKLQLTLIYSLCLLIFTSCNKNSKKESNDPYNFNFERNYSENNNEFSWEISGTYFKIRKDTINKFEGNSSCSIINPNNLKSSTGRLRIFQKVRICPTNNEIKISIYLKGKKIQNCMIKAYLLDQNEQIVIEDSLAFHPSIDWTNYNFKLKNADCELLFLEFIIGKGSEIWVDNLNVTQNGESINILRNKEISNSQIFGNRIIEKSFLWQKDSELSLSDSLTDFENYNVVGIGETVHGAKEMVLYRNSLIKYLIKKYNYTTVILEAPDFYMNEANKFINGEISDERILMNYRKHFAQYYNYAISNIELFKWLKEYNLKHDNNVVVLGMDVSHEWRTYIHKYLGKFNFPIINEIDNNIKSHNIKTAVDIINKNQDFLVDKMGATYYDSLQFIVKKIIDFNSVYDSRSNNKSRDLIMYHNIIKLIPPDKNESCQKTIICGHFEHLGKGTFLNDPLTKTVGSMLADELKDKYFVIAEITGGGTNQSGSFFIQPNSINKLQKPDDSSIEFLFKNMNNCYVNTNDISKDIPELITIRSIGGRINDFNQFVTCNFKTRCDGIIYIKECTPIEIVLSQ